MSEVKFPSFMPAKISVGTIEGRHPMPVDCYLLHPEATDTYGFHEGIMNAAYIFAERLVDDYKPDAIHFYPTGLTMAVLGALKGFKASGVKVIIMSFDSVSKEYVAIEY